MKNKPIMLFLTVLLVISFTACKQTDIIGNTAIKSFTEVISTMGNQVSSDAAYGGWSLTAPDKTARFIWNNDYSSKSTYDAMLEFESKPFVDAGLDTSKLPAGMVSDGKIIVGIDLGNQKPSSNTTVSPASAFKSIVDTNRDHIKYHSALDHFGIDLSNGNMFEWAKDMAKNDKDIVFVLNPKIFIDAGVDPIKVSGWVFAKVPVMDANGKEIEVDKFLKPFDLK